MKDEAIRTTKKRILNQAIRGDLLEQSLEDIGAKVREAFKTMAREAQTLSDVALATGEIVVQSVGELELRRRIDSALQWKVLTEMLKALPEDIRRELEHEIRTLNLDQLDP